MVSRFTWTNWSQGNVLKHDEKLWQGQHNGYKPVIHKRTVLALESDRWLVVDQLEDKQSHHYALHWLLDDYPFAQDESLVLLSIDSVKHKVQVGLVAGKAVFSVVRGDPNSTRGWRSQYYGDKQPAISVRLETDQARVCFWTFFGFESDRVELAGNKLEIGIDDVKKSINLQHIAPHDFPGKSSAGVSRQLITA